MDEGHPAIRRPENFSSDLEVCCGQYLRTGRTAIDQMFDDTAKESRAIWITELTNNTIDERRDRRGGARTNHETAGGVGAERMNDQYEPVDRVPVPKSSRMISGCSVQFLKAKEIRLRSIVKADCS